MGGSERLQLLCKYLGAWYPILATWSGRVLYVDCNAGRGRHETGNEGSPILAIQSLITHRACNRILASTQVNFMFFENDSKNYQCLLREIAVSGSLPNKINVSVYEKDYEKELTGIVSNMKASGKRLAPAFVFLDPFGFQLSMTLLNDLLSFPKCELFVNFMYHYIDLSMRNPTQTHNMDKLFGGKKWRQIATITDHKQRANDTINYFANQLNAKYVTKMTMLAANNTIKYVLFHATNHDLGRERMKDAMWSVIPDGIFFASERHHPQQLVLIQPKPDLGNLRANLKRNYSGKDVAIKDLYEWLHNEIYKKPHLHAVLSEWRENGLIKFNGDTDRVPFSQNPIISFPSW
ncbi:three-Cys-motif partner protein TcmP [Patescibacteria group bacterium]|nr:three-Cys-motif partner protein TcmP [Patescibacteria group bacterium]